MWLIDAGIESVCNTTNCHKMSAAMLPWAPGPLVAIYASILTSLGASSCQQNTEISGLWKQQQARKLAGKRAQYNQGGTVKSHNYFICLETNYGISYISVLSSCQQNTEISGLWKQQRARKLAGKRAQYNQGGTVKSHNYFICLETNYGISYVNVLEIPYLTHWGRVTHICFGKLTIIGSDNGLLPSLHQDTIWTNAGILLIRTLGTNFCEILIEIHTFSFSKNIWKCCLENGVQLASASMCQVLILVVLNIF